MVSLFLLIGKWYLFFVLFSMRKKFHGLILRTGFFLNWIGSDLTPIHSLLAQTP
jgi:hypothetical protein